MSALAPLARVRSLFSLRPLRDLGALCVPLLFSASSPARQIATFDQLTEGFHPTTFVSNGITFSNGVWFPPPTVNLTFGIDNASATAPALGFGAFFSSPNVMQVGGFVTGPTTGFFRVHSWQAHVPTQTFTSGSVDVFHIDDFIGANAALQAMLGGVVVASDSFTITQSNPGTALHKKLSVSGVTFDRLRFIVTGGPPGGDENGILAFFDNVEMVQSCYPDCNANGVLTVADFTCFQTRFVAGDPYADCNQSGHPDGRGLHLLPVGVRRGMPIGPP